MGWPVKEPSTIYAIRCVHNGKVYIGRTQNLERRMKEHLSELKKGCKRHKGVATEFQKDFDKYGELGFEVYVIETDVEPGVVFSKESKWILEYRSHEPEYGYNKVTGLSGRGFNSFNFGPPPKKAAANEGRTEE